jgi:2-carboxy-D-arabinitol-1-phosphatase
MVRHVLPGASADAHVRPAVQVQHMELPDDAENMADFWQRTSFAWSEVHDAAMVEGGSTVCVVAHAAVHVALLCQCLGLTERELGRFRMSAAGVTVIEFPFSDNIGVVRCHNYTAHLGRWAVPITSEDEVLVCGIDGCF